MQSPYIVTRDNIEIIKKQDLNYMPSIMQREITARNEPMLYSKQSDLNQVNIPNRGLLSSVMNSQAKFTVPMINSQEELVKRFTRSQSGLASNRLLNQERVENGIKIMNNTQSVGYRLY